MGLFMTIDEYLAQGPHCTYCGAEFPTWDDESAHPCDAKRQHRESIDRKRAAMGLDPKQWRN
jgi:hypothetical protein